MLNFKDYFILKNIFGEDNIYSYPRPDFKGQSPDNFYILKKAYFIESLIDNETIKKFLSKLFYTI